MWGSCRQVDDEGFVVHGRESGLFFKLLFSILRVTMQIDCEIHGIATGF